MRPQISGIFITEKDIHFFNYLYAVKVATYSQINRDIYTGYTRKSVANRIRKMEDNHLLEGYQKRNIANGQRFISLTKKGFDGFVKRGYEKRVEPKSGSVTHDLFLVDIRHKLMKQNRVKGYTTENELQTWGHPLGDASYLDFVYLRPDAVTGLQCPTCIIQIPVEYDAFHKSRNRYVNVVKQYYDSAVVPNCSLNH